MQDTHHVQQHRLDHEAVVIVPLEQVAVAVRAVAFVAFEVFVDREVYSHQVAAVVVVEQERFDDAAEKQPVVGRSADRAGGFQGIDDLPFDSFVQTPPDLFGRPHQPVREEGRIDQRLLVFREVHAIGRLRVGRVVEAFQYQFDVARPFPAFDGAVRAEFEPRGDPGQRAAERFEVAHVLRSVDLRFERHRRFQALFAQRGQYRQSRPVERGDPVFAGRGFGRLRSFAFAGQRGAKQAGEQRRRIQQEVDPFHDSVGLGLRCCRTNATVCTKLTIFCRKSKCRENGAVRFCRLAGKKRICVIHAKLGRKFAA